MQLLVNNVYENVQNIESRDKDALIKKTHVLEYSMLVHFNSLNCLKPF